jgi:hypothetical protein
VDVQRKETAAARKQHGEQQFHLIRVFYEATRYEYIIHYTLQNIVQNSTARLNSPLSEIFYLEVDLGNTQISSCGLFFFVI